MKHYLFSYGTLQLQKVQIETYGRILKGSEDSLMGFKLDALEITDPEVLKKSAQKFHPIAKKSACPGDTINGKIFEITDDELKATDSYEVSYYQRVLAEFKSGQKAWVYVAKT